tara:strand:- start:665 stop:3739 length:3075 start_codon:yes stop_codon:yes gene_type:complete
MAAVVPPINIPTTPRCDPLSIDNIGNIDNGKYNNFTAGKELIFATYDITDIKIKINKIPMDRSQPHITIEHEIEPNYVFDDRSGLDPSPPFTGQQVDNHYKNFTDSNKDGTPVELLRKLGLYRIDNKLRGPNRNPPHPAFGVAHGNDFKTHYNTFLESANSRDLLRQLNLIPLTRNKDKSYNTNLTQHDYIYAAEDGGAYGPQYYISGFINPNNKNALKKLGTLGSLFDPGSSTNTNVAHYFPDVNQVIVLDNQLCSLLGFGSKTFIFAERNDSGNVWTYQVYINGICMGTFKDYTCNLQSHENGTTINDSETDDKYVKQLFNKGNNLKKDFMKKLSGNPGRSISDYLITIIIAKQMGDVLQVIFTLICNLLENDGGNVTIATGDSMVFLLCVMLKCPCIFSSSSKKSDALDKIIKNLSLRTQVPDTPSKKVFLLEYLPQDQSIDDKFQGLKLKLINETKLKYKGLESATVTNEDLLKTLLNIDDEGQLEIAIKLYIAFAEIIYFAFNFCISAIDLYDRLSLEERAGLNPAGSAEGETQREPLFQEKKELFADYSLIPFTSVKPRKGKIYSVRLLQSKKICKNNDFHMVVMLKAMEIMGIDANNVSKKILNKSIIDMYAFIIKHLFKSDCVLAYENINLNFSNFITRNNVKLQQNAVDTLRAVNALTATGATVQVSTDPGKKAGGSSFLSEEEEMKIDEPEPIGYSIEYIFDYCLKELYIKNYYTIPRDDNIGKFMAFPPTCEKFNLLLEIAYGESVRPLIPLQDDFIYYLNILLDYLPPIDDDYYHEEFDTYYHLALPPPDLRAAEDANDTPPPQLDINEEDYLPTDGEESHSFINKETLLELIGLNDDSNTYDDMYKFLTNLQEIYPEYLTRPGNIVHEIYHLILEEIESINVINESVELTKTKGLLVEEIQMKAIKAKLNEKISKKTAEKKKGLGKKEEGVGKKKGPGISFKKTIPRMNSKMGRKKLIFGGGVKSIKKRKINNKKTKKKSTTIKIRINNTSLRRKDNLKSKKKSKKKIKKN